MITRICDILCSKDKRVTTSQDFSLTLVFVQQENNSKDLFEENNDKSSLNQRVRILSSFIEDIQQSVIFDTFQFKSSTLHKYRRLQATRIRNNDLSS